MRRREFLWFGAAAPLAGQSPPRRGLPPLKIVKVEAFVLRTPKDDSPPEKLIGMPPPGAMTGGPGLWNRLDHASPSRFHGYTQATLVKITTSDGITGWGECHAPAAPRVQKTIVTDALAPLLLGLDARDVEVLWERMYSSERTRGYSTGFWTEAIAGIDLALWDILGKYTGQPLYRLLGGKFRERIPTYTGIGGATPEAIRENARRAVEQGFPAVKMGLSKGPGTRDLDRVAAVSEAVGSKAQLLLDSLGAYKLHEAVKVGRELDKLKNIGWWEDALLPDDTANFAKLADALDTPICAGEELSNRFQFRDLFTPRGVDIINPDVCRAGGITECRRIAMLADVHGILWSPHVSTGTPLYMSASLHLAAATPNFVIMEGGNAHAGPFGNVLLKEPLDYKPGSARVPEGPGLGVEFDEKALAKVLIG
jgi:L-alanine-DL-glutamate epimerase-like enolase superfamily enzyme